MSVQSADFLPTDDPDTRPMADPVQRHHPGTPPENPLRGDSSQRTGLAVLRSVQRLRKAEAETEDSIPAFPSKQLTNRGLQPIARLSRLRAPRHRNQGRRQHGQNPEWRLVIPAAFQRGQRGEEEKCSAGFKLQPFARNFMDPVEIPFGRYG